MKIRRIDFSPDEWLAGTASLDNAERGLYITACALIYSHGGPIQIDELRRHSHDHGNAFNRQLRRLVGLGKLLRNGSNLANKRCENELERARKRSAKGKELADERWKNNDVDDAAALQGSNGNHQPSTINHQPSDSDANASGASPPAAEPDPVKEIFDRGLRVLGPKGRSLLGKMRQQHGDAAVVEAIIACEDAHPSDPAPFFIRCLARAPPKHVNGQQASPATNLFEGAYRAAESFIARHPGNRSADSPADEPLLDGGGPAGAAPGPNRRLA